MNPDNMPQLVKAVAGVVIIACIVFLIGTLMRGVANFVLNLIPLAIIAFVAYMLYQYLNKNKQ